MHHVRVAVAADLGANEKCMSRHASVFNATLAFNGYRHMTSVAMQAFQLVCCMCEIFKTLGVAGTAEQVTAV